MLPILVAVLVWIPALVGLGSPAANALRRATGAVVGGAALRAAIAGLLGMFVAATATAAANFLVPAYPLVSSGLLVAGWALVLRERRRWLRLPPRAWRTAGVVALLVALADARGMRLYDAGIYHLQAVRWVTSGPLPRGLANLFGSLGYNCAWFTFTAAVETPLLLGRGGFVVNAVLAVLLALPSVDSVMRWRGRAFRQYRVVLAMMLYPLAMYGIRDTMISSPAPDLVVIMLVLLSTALWVRSPRFAPHAMTLACFAASIKLSAVPFLALAAVATGVWALRGPRRPRRAAPVALFCALAAAIFLARGIWLSGYPAFPSTVGRVAGLSWTSPRAHVTRVARTIESWSKHHKLDEGVTPATPWVSWWVRRVGSSQPVVVAAIVIVTGAGLWVWRRPRLDAQSARSVLAMVAMLPAVAFWFITAPQPRFGYGYIFGVASLVFAVGLSGFVPRKIDPPVRQWATAGATVGLLLLAQIDLHLLKATWIRWPQIPRATLVTRRTVDGLVVHMPRGDDRVWAAPLPATPELDPNLRCEIDAKGIRRFWIEAPPNNSHVSSRP
ncbi:MAG: hypothetical protein JWL69_4762 [Phycisphaerales bacterium]|nr:hypothetical protein [Phycisphaerales bacterium]